MKNPHREDIDETSDHEDQIEILEISSIVKKKFGNTLILSTLITVHLARMTMQ